MKPAYVKWCVVFALAAMAYCFRSELCGLGAVIVFIGIDDEDYR
jgi:hypothetical protein